MGAGVRSRHSHASTTQIVNKPKGYHTPTLGRRGVHLLICACTTNPAGCRTPTRAAISIGASAAHKRVGSSAPTKPSTTTKLYRARRELVTTAGAPDERIGQHLAASPGPQPHQRRPHRNRRQRARRTVRGKQRHHPRTRRSPRTRPNRADRVVQPQQQPHRRRSGTETPRCAGPQGRLWAACWRHRHRPSTCRRVRLRWSRRRPQPRQAIRPVVCRARRPQHRPVRHLHGGGSESDHSHAVAQLGMKKGPPVAQQDVLRGAPAGLVHEVGAGVRARVRAGAGAPAGGGTARSAAAAQRGLR